MSDNKETLEKRLSIPVTPTLYTELEKQAENSERSVVSQARFLIKKGMEAELLKKAA